MTAERAAYIVRLDRMGLAGCFKDETIQAAKAMDASQRPRFHGVKAATSTSVFNPRRPRPIRPGGWRAPMMV